MNQTDLLPFILLGYAGTLIAILLLLQNQRKLNQLLGRRTPQFPDLTQSFIELQHRIDSEGRLTRKKMDAVEDVLTHRINEGTTTYSKVAQTIAEIVRNEFTSLRELVVADGKKTRERTAQIKTRLTDDEKDDQRVKAKARRVAKKTTKPKGSK